MIFEYMREPTLGNLLPCRDAFKYLERGMTCVGWMPPPRGSRYYRIYLCWMAWVHFSAEIYTPILFVVGYVNYFSTYKPGAFLSSAQSFCNVISLIFKIAFLCTNVWRFQKAKQLLDILDKRCVTVEERFEVHRCVARCNSVYMLFQTAYSTYSTLTFLSSAFRGSPAWMSYNPFVDYRKSTRNLWIASIVDYIISSGAIYSDQMTDVYPVIFALILRTQVQLLIQRIRNLRTDPDETDNQSYEELVNCIKDHKLILEYCDLFRPVIARTFLAQLFAIGMGLGLSLVNLFFFSTLWTGLATVIFIFVLLIQTFPFCYACELIKDDCYTLNLAIFYSNYYDANRRYKSTIFFFMQQAQRSIDFTAGGIFPICMKTNIDFAKFAFTVVAFVNEMHIVDKLKLN